MHNFVSSSIGYLGNIRSLTYADLSNVDTSHSVIFLKLRSLK
jgi:hypothetical protein